MKKTNLEFLNEMNEESETLEEKAVKSVISEVLSDFDALIQDPDREIGKYFKYYKSYKAWLESEIEDE